MIFPLTSEMGLLIHIIISRIKTSPCKQVEEEWNDLPLPSLQLVEEEHDEAAMCLMISSDHSFKTKVVVVLKGHKQTHKGCTSICHAITFSDL